MAVLFLLLAVLVGVVLVDAMLENTNAATLTLFDRSFDQLRSGELLLVFAGLGFLLALLLFLAFSSSRTRRSRRKEKRAARRDAEGRVEELERENARLRQELDRAGRVGRLTGERSGATAVDQRPPAQEDRRTWADERNRQSAAPPQPTSMRRERIDDRTEPVPPPRQAPAGTADENARRR
jgi:hypothetical protein